MLQVYWPRVAYLAPVLMAHVSLRVRPSAEIRDGQELMHLPAAEGGFSVMAC